MSRPAVSAIIVSYRTGPRLRDCLHVLAGDPEIGEIVLVDNGNPPADEAWIDGFAARVDHVKLIRPRENLGFGKAANLGARRAGREVLLFLNPDAMVKRGAVGALMEAAEDARSPWLVGGRIFGLDGREQRGCRRRELNWATATGLVRWTLERTSPPSGPVAMPVVSGAFFAIPRTHLLSLDGGFDESYFLHVEDVDLCRRVRQAGGQVIYQPAAGALHFGATSDAPSRIVQAHKADGLMHYFRKFANGPLDRALNALLLPLLVWRVRRG